MEKELLNPQTHKSNFPRLKVTLKIRRKNGGTLTYHSSKTKRIFSILRQQNFAEAYLKVDYRKGFTNSGVYKSKKESLFALRTFADKSLTDYLKS